LEVCAHFGRDDIGLGYALCFGLAEADRDGPASAVEAYGRVVLVVGGKENFAIEGAVAVADAFVFGG